MRACPATCSRAELVHDAVAVTLEQRHQRLHAGERAALLVAGEERDEAAVVERVAPAAELVGRARERLHERAADRDRSTTSALVDQRQVVAASSTARR